MYSTSSASITSRFDSLRITASRVQSGFNRVAKIILSPAQAGWQIDLNSRLRNSDQIDSVTFVGSARVKKTLLGVVVNSESDYLSNQAFSAFQ
jgi:hypothetical protein